MEDEYEYTVQRVSARGKRYPTNICGDINYQWLDRESAEEVRLTLQELEKEEGIEDFTFRLVRRKKAGPVEVDPDGGA